MKLRLIATCCLSWAVIDVIASSLLFYKIYTEAGSDDDLKYSFSTAAVDFVVLSMLRFALVCGVVFGIILNTVDGLSRLKKANMFLVCFLLLCMSYSPLKLLALAEVMEPQEMILYFWLIFSWNIFSSAVVGLLFLFCLPKISSGPRNEGAESDEEQLIRSEDEIVVEGVANGHLSDSADNRANKGVKSSSDDDMESEDKKKIELRKSMSLVFRLYKYCGRALSWYLVGTVFLFAYSGARVFIPSYMGDVISNIVITRSYADLKHSVLLMALLSIASSISAGIRGGCFTYAIALVNNYVRCDLFRSLTKQEICFYDKTKTGDITSRLTADTQSMSDAISSNLNVFLRTLVMFLGTLAWMYSLSWRLTTLNFVLMPVIAIICKAYGGYYERLAKDVQDTLAKTNEVAEEVVSTMRTVRSFANEMREAKRYDERLQGTLSVKRKQSICYALYMWIMELVDVLFNACVLFYGGHLVLTDKMSSKELITFLLYQLQLGEAIYTFGYCFTGLMQAVGASHKVFELIDRQPEILNDGKLKPDTFEGRIEFKNVQFSYPSRKEAIALKNISFTVSPGEVVALVGPSGGGKSSCIALLEHFYEPLSGSILIDGIPVEKYDHEFIHRKIALVAQEPVLYAESIQDNIAYALESHEWNEEVVRNAAKQANAHNFIIELPKGYGTGTGERGVQLSGGQKQRVCIARALIRNPKILLLDEATSALDAESEYLVQQAIYNNLEGHTVLLIAHRLSTVEKADKIVVINHGQVEQIGSHQQLLASEGLYKDLVHRQLLGATSTNNSDAPATEAASNIAANAAVAVHNMPLIKAAKEMSPPMNVFSRPRALTMDTCSAGLENPADNCSNNKTYSSSPT